MSQLQAFRPDRLRTAASGRRSNAGRAVPRLSGTDVRSHTTDRCLLRSSSSWRFEAASEEQHEQHVDGGHQRSRGRHRRSRWPSATGIEVSVPGELSRRRSKWLSGISHHAGGGWRSAPRDINAILAAGGQGRFCSSPAGSPRAASAQRSRLSSVEIEMALGRPVAIGIAILLVDSQDRLLTIAPSPSIATGHMLSDARDCGIRCQP